MVEPGVPVGGRLVGRGCAVRGGDGPETAVAHRRDLPEDGRPTARRAERIGPSRLRRLRRARWNARPKRRIRTAR